MASFTFLSKNIGKDLKFFFNNTAENRAGKPIFYSNLSGRSLLLACLTTLKRSALFRTFKIFYLFCRNGGPSSIGWKTMEYYPTLLIL